MRFSGRENVDVTEQCSKNGLDGIHQDRIFEYFTFGLCSIVFRGDPFLENTPGKAETLISMVDVRGHQGFSLQRCVYSSHAN